jgi:DNA mismatch repair protein MSH3
LHTVSINLLWRSYVDEVGSVDDLDKYSAPPLLCLIESHKPDSAEGDISIGMIAIMPSTGDVIWDEFNGMNNRVTTWNY